MVSIEQLRTAVTPKRVTGLLAIVLVLGGWWEFLRPSVVGGSTTLVTVTGDSMEPGMHTGDLAVVRTGDDYAIGDVVAFRVPRGDGSRGGVVIHRIVDGDPVDGFRLRGDNNDFVDPWRPTADQIEGELVLHVPAAGRVIAAMKDPALAGAVFAALTVFLVLIGGDRGKSEDEQPEQTPARSGGST